MGNFETHQRAGKKYGVIALIVATAIAFQWNGELSAALLVGLTAGAYGFVASLLPDIDHQDSIPRRKAGKLLSVVILVAIVLLPAIAPDFTKGLGRLAIMIGIGTDPLVVGSGVLLLVGAGLLFTGGNIFDRATTHRGFTHSLGFAFCLSLVAFFSLRYVGSIDPSLGTLSSELGVLVALATAGGVVVHLYVDQ